jgi:hypothetical protein
MTGVPHLQELSDKYRNRGFELVAVSPEAEATIQTKLIDAKKVTYGVVKANIGAVYESRGIPHCWVLDPEGKCIFKGHPNSVTVEMVGEWVKDFGPIKLEREVAKDLQDVAETFNKGEYGKALVAAQKAGAASEDEQVKADAKFIEEQAQEHVDGYTRRMEAARTAGDLVKLSKLMEEAAARFKGSEQGDKWDGEAKELVKSKEYKDTLKAQEALDELKPKLEDMKGSKARKDLEKIAKKYPDTKAGKEAAELAKRYE